MVLSIRPRFWLFFIFLSVFAGWLSYQYIGQVYSLVNLSITADRMQILAEAKNLAHELKWDIEGYAHVISFDSEDDLQCFVELEAGGKETFVEMFQSGKYYPYHWHVRFFKEKEIKEMHAWFSPQGKRLGFYKKVSEQAPGEILEKKQAQDLVENIIGLWCCNFENYELIEYDCQSHETGRVDHDFTYERKDITLGKGLYRFRAVVSGNEITKLEPSIKVPDNFMRRYQQMRSANHLLTSVGSFFFRSLYFLFFGLLGLVFLYRRNYLMTRYAAFMAALVAGGMFLRGLNEFPLWWTSYNTVQSTTTFICMKFFEQILTFISLFAMIFFVLVVAEAAGRFVYKNHVQFFKTFELQALGSYQIVQQIALGYLLVPCMFLFIVIFGYISKEYFGWWSPAGSLTDPNVVASYFPWLGAVTISLFAGFFEEVICRALPLSMVEFLAKDSKYKKFWVVSIFILQALIFGACHANYPNQPFYARLVELIPVSFLFGWLYLNFGLLPGVILHFVYDAVWFSIPIFTSTLFWSQCMVIFLVGLPCILAFCVYVYQQKLHELPVQYFNSAFQAAGYIPHARQPRIFGTQIPARNKSMVFTLGLLGTLLWIGTYKFKPDVAPLLITQEQAIQIARQTIEDKFDRCLDAAWTPIASVQDDVHTVSTRFIWQVYGPAAYDFLQGSYISGVTWLVRFVKFAGEVEERGEEYKVAISSCHAERHTLRQPILEYAGHVVNGFHKLPEHFAGADIDQMHAEKIAYNFIEKEYGLLPQDLKLLAITNDKFEQRRDWTLVFQDTQVFDFDLQGQARVNITISGDKVTDYSRFIFVPESWKRAEEERLMNVNLFKTGLMFLLFILAVFGTIFSVMRLMTSDVASQIFKQKALFVFIVSILSTLNSLNFLIANFTTAEPFYDQLVRLSLGLVTTISWQVLLCSLFLTAAAVSFTRASEISYRYSYMLASAVAFFMLGMSSVFTYYEPYLEPTVGNYSAACHWSPTLSLIVGYLKIFYFILSLVIIMFVVLKTLRDRLPHMPFLQPCVSILFFIALEGLQNHSTISWMLLHGVLMGILMFVMYQLLLKYDMSLLPLFFGAFVACMAFPEILYPLYPGAHFDACIGFFVLVTTSLFFYRLAHKE